MLVECDKCGKAFDRRPDQVKKYKNCFCSKECHGKYKSLNPRGVSCEIVTCENCGVRFKKKLCEIRTSNSNFCSKECSYKRDHSNDNFNLKHGMTKHKL